MIKYTNMLVDLIFGGGGQKAKIIYASIKKDIQR
jgi:hypothetical protein